MSLVDESVWAGLKVELSRRIPESSFDLWFAGAEVVSWEDGHLEIGVQHRFIKIRIENAYLDLLREAAEASLGQTVRVSVTVSKHLYAAFRKSQKEAIDQAAKLDLEPIFTPPPPPAPVKPVHGLDLNPEFTFDSFVVGASNRLAHAVALRALDQPGAFPRIYLCGHHGVGKTHLLQAICHGIRARRPEAKVVYVSSERFMADFMSAYHNHTMKEFRAFYRGCDVLAFDEVQALGAGNRGGTQAELLGTIDDLDARGKQVVFAAIPLPSELEGVDAKLRDRLGAGFVDKLSLPDIETRQNLIVRKMAAKHIALPSDALALLARELSGNVRQLEGTVNRLAALIDLEGMEPTTSCIRMALEVARPPLRKSSLTFADIIQAVADEFGLTPEAVIGRARSAAVRQARQIAIVLCRQVIGGRYAELGKVFGNRSHATIMSAVKTVNHDHFSSGLKGRPVERILFRLGLTVKPEELLERQKGLFD